jgi:outer membrane lipoprotein-sorting protein
VNFPLEHPRRPNRLASSHRRCALRRRVLVHVVCLLLAAVFASVASAKEDGAEVDAAKPRKDDPISWYTSTIAKDQTGGFLLMHFWSKGPLLRSEAVIAGRPIVTIVDATTYYIFERVSGQGVAIERSARAINQDATRGRPFANDLDDLIANGGELIETRQTTAGPVDIYRLTDETGRRTIWMSTKVPRVPLRVETFDRASASTGEIEYVNWIYGAEIPDSFFAPEPRIEFEKLSYAEYKRRLGRETIGPAPVLYRDLLHGSGDGD